MLFQSVLTLITTSALSTMYFMGVTDKMIHNVNTNTPPMTINPFQRCSFPSNIVNVPEPHFSLSSQRYHYGGFTADMGWLLMVARWSIANNEYFEFPTHWGHSESGGCWNDMFSAVTAPECLSRHGNAYLLLHDQQNSRTRRMIKFKDYYTGKNTTFHPNNEIIKLMNKSVSSTDDLTSMRQLFKWVFRLKPSIQRIIDEEYFLMELPERYVSMHIRWGDKVGESDNKNDPKEGVKVPLKEYTKHVPDDIDTIFVATDDVRSIDELEGLLPGKKIITLSTGNGFSISEYMPRLKDTIKLWAEMQYMAGAELFITNMESNVAKTVHLMMSNDSKTINVRGGFKCCDNNRYNNCFWLCH